MTLKPGRAIDLNISASLEFLARVIPKPLAPFHRSLKSGHLLEQQRLEKLPTKLKPDEERMARRLKLVHETRGRVNPKPRRRLKEVGGSIAMIKRSGCTLFRPTRCWSSGKCGEMPKLKIATKALANRPATSPQYGFDSQYRGPHDHGIDFNNTPLDNTGMETAMNGYRYPVDDPFHYTNDSNTVGFSNAPLWVPIPEQSWIPGLQRAFCYSYHDSEQHFWVPKLFKSPA